MPQCRGCGDPFTAPPTRGRPRVSCTKCLPPVDVIGRAEYARRWRAISRELVDAQDAERRRRYAEERARATRRATTILARRREADD